MDNETFPITPPPELVREWAQVNGEKDLERFWLRLATQAARWGSDQELEACCEWVGQFNYDDYSYGERLRAARRRPKPPSLKERALKALDDISIASYEQNAANTIRQALEALND